MLWPLGVVCLNTTIIITCSSLPEASLLSIFSLGCQGAPGVSVWHGTSEFPTDLTQDLSKVVALCVWGTHLLPGDPEVQCVCWDWQHWLSLMKHSHGGFFFFNAWGSLLFHRWLLGAPKLMGVPDQGVLQLSFHSPFLSCSHGRKGRICPSCLCWCYILYLPLPSSLSANDVSCP